MVSINILKKGDEVLAITDRILAVKRKNGEVDIFNVMFSEENEFIVDPLKVATIGFGEGTVSKTMGDNETIVYSF